MNTRPEILIAPTIPTELEYISPRETLSKSWWDKTRKSLEKETGGRCQVCGTHKDDAWYTKYLEGHELCHVDNKLGYLVLDEVVVLCSPCHSFIHIGRMARDRFEGVIGDSYFKNVLTHGITLLTSAGLKPTTTQGIHYLMHIKGYNKSDAIAHVIKSDMINTRQDINMNREWRLFYNGTVHI